MYCKYSRTFNFYIQYFNYSVQIFITNPIVEVFIGIIYLKGEGYATYP
jgi:hypothetical protein